MNDDRTSVTPPDGLQSWRVEVADIKLEIRQLASRFDLIEGRKWGVPWWAWSLIGVAWGLAIGIVIGGRLAAHA